MGSQGHGPQRRTPEPVPSIEQATALIVRETRSDADPRDVAKKKALLDSTDMVPVQGTVDVDVPVGVLWEAFAQARCWPRWNRCFFWTHTGRLVAGRMLIWAFEPIRWWYFYKMFAIAKIVELEPGRKVTWEVTALPGFYARHTYHMQAIDDGRTRFGSWEQAQGAQVRWPLTKKFWVAHFTFVKDASLEGARRLEREYRRDHRITPEALPRRAYWPFWSSVALLAVLCVAAVIVGRFYVDYLRPTEVQLAPGVSAVLAGGGNSLIVQDGDAVLLVDTKFPPAADWLRQRIGGEIGKPVQAVVDTHFHYDHTQGNTNYPAATIYAHRAVPDLMRKRDGAWWADHESGIPTELVDDRRVVRVGAQDLVLIHPGPGHTQGDLFVDLQRAGTEIVATGDLVFHTYYPFMDLGEGGIDLPSLIGAVRSLAADYPTARFVPGHGPIASAEDIARYADYLQALSDAVAQARRDGLTEDEAVARIDLSAWHRSPLPSFHDGKLCWATAEMNIRWVYQLQAGTRLARSDCTF